MSEIDQKETAPQTEETGDRKGKKEKPKKSVGREIIEWVLTVVVAVVLALCIRNFIAEPVKVDGHSMDYTLADGEVMLVTKYDYLLGAPQRFDIVICHYPDRKSTVLFGIETDTNFVKRIVGLPGDKLAVVDGYLYVNGEKCEETYLTTEYGDNHPQYTLVNRWDEDGADYGKTYTLEDPYVVPDGCYFVMGDNRNNSNDSHIIGPLTRSQIVGHVRCVFYPFSAIRGVK